MERLQELGRGGMEGARLGGPLPSSHGPGERMAPGAGGEGDGNGDIASRAGWGSPVGLLLQERDFVPVPRCASQLLALSVRLNRELDVSKRINFLILL